MNAMRSVTAVILLQIIGVLSAGCNWSLYQHYEQKGCEPVLGENGCPIRFACKPLTDADRKTCLHGGRRYVDREVIKTTDPCDSCSCTTAWDSGDAMIECAEVDCPDWDTKNKSCYMGLKPELCCPTEMCPSEDATLRKTCTHNGKTYKIGQYMEMQDPCQTCICTEQWSGPDGRGCSKVDCKLGRDVRRLRKGCIPVYRENGCCPIDMNCGGLYGATPVSFPENKDFLCQHQGQFYELGSTAYLQNDKYQCISCTCSVPPDFTCVKKACPSPQGKNCKARYGPCCPKYECD